MEIKNLEIKLTWKLNFTMIIVIIIKIHMYFTVIYIIYERSSIFLTILKQFKISGLQTQMAFKQRFKY